VAEAVPDAARAALSQTAKAVGFIITRSVIEAEGLCPSCNKASVS
jgi:Fur family transcriptional regulator, zinc uptake regulator